jgi:hypothetical protein
MPLCLIYVRFNVLPAMAVIHDEGLCIVVLCIVTYTSCWAATTKRTTKQQPLLGNGYNSRTPCEPIRDATSRAGL